jgi:hypothetical protein
MGGHSLKNAKDKKNDKRESNTEPIKGHRIVIADRQGV